MFLQFHVCYLLEFEVNEWDTWQQIYTEASSWKANVRFLHINIHARKEESNLDDLHL